MASRDMGEDANLREALVESSHAYFAWVVVLLLLGLVGMQLVFWAASNPLKVLGGVSAGLFVAAATAVRYPLGRRLVRHELKWLRTLPFDASSYEAALRASPSRTCTVRAAAQLASEQAPLSPATLASLVGRVGVASVKLDGAIVRVSSSSLDCSDSEGAVTNSSVRRWMHELICSVLLPLHETHPVVAVRFERD